MNVALSPNWAKSLAPRATASRSQRNWNFWTSFMNSRIAVSRTPTRTCVLTKMIFYFCHGLDPREQTIQPSKIPDALFVPGVCVCTYVCNIYIYIWSRVEHRKHKHAIKNRITKKSNSTGRVTRKIKKTIKKTQNKQKQMHFPQFFVLFFVFSCLSCWRVVLFLFFFLLFPWFCFSSLFFMFALFFCYYFYLSNPIFSVLLDS